MRFSDFLLVSNPTDLDFIVGYTDEQNIRINVLDLFTGQIIGGGTAGHLPVFTASNVITDSVLFQDGSNLVIGGEDSLGYKLAIAGSLLALDGVVIESSIPGSNTFKTIGEEGDSFIIPHDSSESIQTVRTIIHAPAVLSTESATLGQVNSAILALEGDIDILLDLKVDKTSVGAPNGVASLDATGKVPLSEIPDSIIGQVEYMGTWNAFTNTPTLDPLVPEEKGHYYVVSEGGTFGGVEYQVGDWIISNGVIWEKVDNTDAVTSVFGRLGAILALEGDYQAFYPRLSQAYDNPTWINSLAFTKITGVPPFLLENQTITLSGDVTGSGKTSIASTISDNVVTNSKLRDSVGTSVIGRASSTSGDPADIQASTDGYVLQRSGGSLLFGLISSDSIGSIDWSKIINTPTTLSGYGITDVYTKTESDNKFVPYTGANANVNLGLNSITANSLIKAGGTSAQFLKADGSVDTGQYVPTTRSVNAGTGLTGGGNLSSDITIAFDTTWGDNRYAYRTRQLTINGTTYDLSADRIWNVGTVNTLTTTGTSGPATLVGSTLNIPNYTTDLSGYVPYTGATQALELGYNALSASFLRVNGNSPTTGSYLGFKHSTSVTSGAPDYTSIYTFGTNLIGFKSISGATTKDFSFSMAGITPGVPGGRVYTMPDSDGTIALLSDIPSLAGYVTLDTTQTITGFKTILRGGDVLNFKIGTDTLYGLKVAYNQNELVPSGEATWSFVSTFNNGSGTGLETTPISFFRGVLVTGERLLSPSVNANLLDYYGNNPSGRYPIYAYNTGVQQFASSIIVGETTGAVDPVTGAIADLPAGVVANFKGRVIGSNAVNNNEFATLGQVNTISGSFVTLDTAQTITAQKTFTTSGSSDTMIISHGSGSGFALDVIKAGDGEGIRVQKTSGSGNAMTVIGGDFEAPTIVKTGGTSSQYLMADGSVSTLTNPVTGTGVSGQVAFWDGTTTQTGDNGLFWDNTNKRLGVGDTAPVAPLHVNGQNALGLTAWFGNNNSYVNIDTYHYADARVGISGRDSNGTDRGAGIEYTARNTANSNWLHGYTIFNRDGSYVFGLNGSGSTQATERWRITSAGIFQSNGAQTIQTSSGALTLQGNGGDTIINPTSGFVGIGVTNMSSFWNQAENLVIGQSGNVGLTIYSSTSGNNVIAFADVADGANSGFNAGGSILYSHGDDSLQFRVNGAERLRIESTGVVNVTRNDRALGAELRLTNSAGSSSWVAGDIVGTLNFVSTDASTSQPIRSQIQAISTFGNTYPVSMNLTFSTAQGNTLTEGFRLTNLSNLLVGTTTDNGAKLQVSGDGYFSGNVGIGSIAPTIKFEVNTGSNSAYFTRTANDYGITSPAFGILNDANSPRLYSFGTGMEFWTAAVGGAINQRWQITSTGILQSNGAQTIQTSSGALTLQPTGGVNLATSSGNVGIGTASPSFKLDIVGSDNSQLRLDSSDTFDTTIIMDYNGGGATNRVRIRNASGSLAFNTANSLERMRITSSGNVLIGTTTDSGQKLQVDGAVNISIGNSYQIDGGRFLLYNGGTFIGDIDNKGGAVYIREDGLNTITIQGQNTSFNGDILPVTDNTGVVGNGSFTWADGRFTNFLVDSLLNVRGAIDLADFDVLRFGSSDDAYFVYNGTSNFFELQLEAAATEFRITDNGTSRFTFEKSTGNLIATGAVTAGGNYLINNLTASKKGYTYQSPASNWGPQVSGLYFTPNNAIDAATTFTVELWNGIGSTITPLTIASSGNVGIGTSSPSSKLQVEVPLESPATGAVALIAKTSNGANDIFRWFDGATQLGVFKNNGNVLIGTTTDSGARLNVGGSYMDYPVSIEAKSGGGQLALTRSGAVAEFYMGGSTGAGTQLYVRSGGIGGVYLAAGSTGWVSASDIRLKDVTKPIENAVESLSSLQTIYYSWKDSIDKSLHIGLIAQEVEKVFPELILESSIDGMKGVNYTELIPVIIKAIQELNEKINK